jgi:hypothetical protein
MLGLFWAGAALCAYLGYKLYDWWLPAIAAAVVAASQLALLQTSGDRGPVLQMVAFAIMDLLMFHATFAIGRGLGLRRQRRRGVR